MIAVFLGIIGTWIELVGPFFTWPGGQFPLP